MFDVFDVVLNATLKYVMEFFLLMTQNFQNSYLSQPRSSRPEVFCENKVLKNSAIFTGKSLKASNFVKKRLPHRCFPVNIAKLLRIPFYTTTPVAASDKHKPPKQLILWLSD